ncbi:hypothetical protein FDP41_012045 [Naegleria fowleri]|uniref:RGS domain-containing protein n=1 Tax=Naegleria fowleri TaxID=5763 RepID=A0A6A5C6R4_NAEFO|nr:uncharacterized protein FDP41_012045 [Naegleria fowleri]KAF0982184.1 hypothetical protein FDP41_012045 [Naegleria fowleri]
MIFGTLFGYICCFILDLRILVGRKIFPCFIFTLDYHFSVPALSCAFILRFIRLVVLTWLNSVKVRVGKRQMLRGSMEDAAIMGTAVSEVAMHELVQQQQLHVIPSMSSDISAVTVGNDVTTTVEIPKSSKTKSPSSEELVFFKKDTYFQNFEKGKLIHVLKFLVSSKFIYITFAIIGFIHLSVYFIVGGVDYYNYTHDIKNPNKKQAFVVDTFVFAAANGCGTGTYHTNMYISYLSIYAFVGIVFAVGALFMKRDIWYVKREIVLTVVNWSFFALVYAVVNLFSQVTTLVDYFVPVAQMTVQIACILDNITTTILPVMYQQIEKKKDSQTNLTLENDDGNRIRKILLNSKWNSLFLQFSEKSFSSEDIMMWNAVEQFKKSIQKN